MAKIATTSASLCFFGDELDPTEITLALGAKPTRAGRKGEIEVVGRRPLKTGFWRLSVEDLRPGDLNMQINQLLAMMSTDCSVWSNLCARFQADIFCGLFMDETNEGGSLEAATVEAMARRGLSLSLDVYGPSPD